jgi:hypothetical protein
VVYQKNGIKLIGSRKACRGKKACSSVVSTGITTNYFVRVKKKRRKKDLGTGEEQAFKVGFPSGAHVCVNIPTSLSVLLPLNMDL